MFDSIGFESTGSRLVRRGCWVQAAGPLARSRWSKTPHEQVHRRGSSLTPASPRWQPREAVPPQGARRDEPAAGRDGLGGKQGGEAKCPSPAARQADCSRRGSNAAGECPREAAAGEMHSRETTRQGECPLGIATRQAKCSPGRHTRATWPSQEGLHVPTGWAPLAEWHVASEMPAAGGWAAGGILGGTSARNELAGRRCGWGVGVFSLSW